MDEIRLLNYLKGELSEEEILQVEAWYEASPDNKKMLEQLYYTMFIGERAAVMESVDVEKSLNRLKTAIKRKEDATTKIRSAKWKRYVFPLAAFFTGIVLTVGLSYITLNNKDPKNKTMLLKDKLEPYRLLLASQSPRRRELMTGCGLPYEPAPKYECEEIYPGTLPAGEVPLFLSRLKSEAYPAPLGANDILLTADTVVISDGEVLGKPCDRGQAAQMLRRLSGRRHTVVSGVTLRTAGRMHTFSAESGVWFRPLSEEEIGYYLDTFAPYDKAGSYGIQEWIGYAAIEKINGSFYNVMGLPIQKVYVELEKFLQ